MSANKRYLQCKPVVYNVTQDRRNDEPWAHNAVMGLSPRAAEQGT